ncbi:MAG: CPBP family intramembrane metalloprotease [Candidatus Eisenbacteria sp.]|nr:CPBP family intramembrane metalloprotease [Candidatus Eisenbacteria bacterium]
MDRNNKRNDYATSLIVSAIFLGIVVLFAAWGSSRAVQYLAVEWAPEWMSVFINYAIMLAVSLILVLASSMGDPSKFGFIRPRVGGGYGAGITWGIVLGVVASFVSLASRAGGMSPLKGLSVVQIVLLVWILASVTEEILVRGYVQSYLAPLMDRGFKVFRMRISLPVILSALFFAAMHLILLTTGTSFLTTYIVVVFAFFLGLIAAYQRERTGSILPAITAHVSFNVGGAIGGAIYVILQIAVFGKTAVEVIRALRG